MLTNAEQTSENFENYTHFKVDILGSPLVFLKPKNWKSLELQKIFFLIQYSEYSLFTTPMLIFPIGLSCHPGGPATLEQFIERWMKKWPFFIKWGKPLWGTDKENPLTPIANIFSDQL